MSCKFYSFKKRIKIQKTINGLRNYKIATLWLKLRILRKIQNTYETTSKIAKCADVVTYLFLRHKLKEDKQGWLISNRQIIFIWFSPGYRLRGYSSASLTMGCSSSMQNKKKLQRSDISINLTDDQKNIIKKTWITIEENRTKIGKQTFIR